MSLVSERLLQYPSIDVCFVSDGDFFSEVPVEVGDVHTGFSMAKERNRSKSHDHEASGCRHFEYNGREN